MEWEQSKRDVLQRADSMLLKPIEIEERNLRELEKDKTAVQNDPVSNVPEAHVNRTFYYTRRPASNISDAGKQGYSENHYTS
jgi:hypothetical protein